MSHHTFSHKPARSGLFFELVVRGAVWVSADQLAFDHGRMTYVIYFVNERAVHKSAEKEKK